jgi:cytochrome c oxidase subunit II
MAGGMTIGRISSWVCGAAVTLAAGVALATEPGRPDPGQIGFQTPVTPIAKEIVGFHDDLLMPIITVISLFVLGLLLYVIWRFNERSNPVPSRTTHNTGLEIAWTVVPIVILFIIAVPSFRLLTDELVIPPGDMTVKVTGSQWHWSYEYPKDQGGGFSFDSYIKPHDEIKPQDGDIWLLSVDNEAVVPVDKTVVLQITAADVIHSFIIQSFGVRIDAVPGRLNETYFKAEREGIYYGQCSKLCGKDHAFMPIVFRVVSQDKYQAWLADAKKKYAAAPGEISVAAAQP